MIYSYPDFYKQFKCIDKECPDTCCSEWQIVIDEASLEKYENYNGEYRAALHDNIDWAEGIFRHNRQGKCAFLRDDMLCDMYINMGKDSLCTTCREYPRHIEEFENVREISLSLSCPEVARIIMNREEKISFISKEDEEEEIFDEFDYFMFSSLEDIREEIFNIIQNREESITERIKKVLQIGVSSQRHYDSGDLILWNEYEEKDKICVENEYELLKKQLSYLSDELELLYDDWENVLTETELILFSKGEESFFESRDKFIGWWNNSGLTSMEIVLEQIIVYFISIYLLGAVYDENIIGKVDACVTHSIEIFMLLWARWVKNEENLKMDDLIEIVYRYSREIEHSDENLEKVEVINWFNRGDSFLTNISADDIMVTNITDDDI